MPEPGAKSDLRAAMRARLAAQARADAAQATTAATRHVTALPELAAARTVFVFLSTPREVGTDELVRHLLDRSVTVCVPRIRDGDGPGVMEPVRLVSLKAVRPGPFGIREPLGDDRLEPQAIDLVVTPGLAFGAAGTRLGQGGGYYDRFLERCRADVVACGFAFAFQRVASVPTHPHDRRVDLLATDAGIERFRDG